MNIKKFLRKLVKFKDHDEFKIFGYKFIIDFEGDITVDDNSIDILFIPVIGLEYNHWDVPAKHMHKEFIFMFGWLLWSGTLEFDISHE